MLLTIEEIKSSKRKGDIRFAADIMGTSPGNASQVLARPNSKKHKILIRVLSRVIYMREMLKTQATNGSDSL